ncbi:MAG: hypothetical protein NW217_05445 [Hyphomicrobiaceae bacterium]|nr:hypothetical protein [Hyphomicrobiaceae bacterium]
MSLRSIPLIFLAFVLYNVVVLFAGNPPAGTDESAAGYLLRQVVFSLPSIRSGEALGFTWGDVIILFTLLLLFAEIVKATFTSTASLIDHGLSMLVFIACLVEFLVVDRAFTSVFFIVMMATLIDVVAGYTIGIRVARRDIGLGNIDGH